MKKLLTFLGVALILAGCTTMQPRTVSVKELSNDGLCKLATYPYGDRYSSQQAALKELKRRGKTCDWPAYARYHIARHAYLNRPFYIHRYFWPRWGWHRNRHHHHHYVTVAGRKYKCAPSGNNMKCGG